jgi:opacity protein-like surface antigen
MNSSTRQGVQTAGPILLLLSLAAACGPMNAQEKDTSETFSHERLFDSGRYEAAVTSGVLFSFSPPGHDHPPINYTTSGLQLGYMLGDVKGDGWWRGNFELAGEGFGNAIFEGEGSYIAGCTLWLRYNFVPRNSTGLVPYAQAGAGFVSTDIDHSIVGQPFNFNLDLALGARYFVGRNWALSLEYRYQHISNAGLNDRNVGINAHGPVLGVSYFF